jgi:hypothetical protein
MWYEISVRCTVCEKPIVIKRVCVSDTGEIGVIGVCLKYAERVKITAAFSELREQMQIATVQ